MGASRIREQDKTVGGEGKPVRIRRGPATVTGDASRGARARSHWDARKAEPGRRGGKAREPGNLPETGKPRIPSWKGVGLNEVSSCRMLPALAGVVASLVLALSASASAAPITVNLRVEGSTKTLFEGPVSSEAILAPPALKRSPVKAAIPVT